MAVTRFAWAGLSATRRSSLRKRSGKAEFAVWKGPRKSLERVSTYPRSPDSRSASNPWTSCAVPIAWSVCSTHRESETSEFTSIASTPATTTARTAGTSAACRSTLDTVASGRSFSTREVEHKYAPRRFPFDRAPPRARGACYARETMDLVGGIFADPRHADGTIENTSPADLSHALGRFPWALGQVDAAVAAARDGAKSMARMSSAERAALVKRIGVVLKAHEEDLSRAIALDVGKPLWEARTEAQACAAKATITADDGLRLVASFPAPGQAGAECRFRPLGVLAVLGPFNFPVHLPNGHVLPALACGNSVVFKPSEIAPHAAEVYARCLVEAGVPAGAFNLVQGPGPVGAKLAAHPGVDGVLFTGSWGVGLAIERATHGQTKILALEMGGKNAAIVLLDADFDKAVYNVLFSAYVSAGQRCTAASRAIVVGDARRFANRIAQLAQKLSIGHPIDEVFMGPLASPAALEKFERGTAAS